MKGVIYCYYINNKYYVGKTYTKEKKRQKDHKYCAYTRNDDYPFAKAIRKYGWENVLNTYTILEEFNYKTKEELNYHLVEAENKWIKEKNSLVPNGYNVQFSNHIEIPHNPNKKETYEKISKKLKGRICNPNWCNRVMCVETGIIYDSVRDAERANGFIKNSIGKTLQGKQRTAKGYHWKFVDKKTPKYDIEKARKKPLVEKHSQKIEVICLETNKHYESINDCARDMFGTINSKRGISKSCKNKVSYKKYNFRFLNQDNPVPSSNK